MFAPDQVVGLGQGLVSGVENFIQLNYATGGMYATQGSFDDEAMRLYQVTLDGDGNLVGQPVDSRAPDRAQINVGFNHYTQPGDAPNDYRYRGGLVRFDNHVLTLPAGVLPNLTSGLHYVEIRKAKPGEVTVGGSSWLVSQNTLGFTPGAMPLALVTVSAGSMITQVRDVRGAVIAGAGGGGGGFYDAVTWMMT